MLCRRSLRTQFCSNVESDRDWLRLVIAKPDVFGAGNELPTVSSTIKEMKSGKTRAEAFEKWDRGGLARYAADVMEPVVSLYCEGAQDLNGYYLQHASEADYAFLTEEGGDKCPFFAAALDTLLQRANLIDRDAATT